MKLLKNLSLFLLLGANFSPAWSQGKDPVFIQFEDEKITKNDFIDIYTKNNSGELVQKSTVEEYLDLYINFKLKVKEAEALGFDTIKEFKKELEGYRKQLAQPYLTEESILEQIKKEAYERLKEDVRVRHILISVGADAPPEDTLKVYEKAIEIRKRLLEGEDFAKVAKQESDDPSAKTNGGDLGYFTAFYMVYPFENEAYETEVGSISDIVRSRFGYHILKVMDKRPAVGNMTAAHILISKNKQLSKTDDPEGKIKEIYQKLEEGEDFKELARQYSDDHKTAVHGGMLPPFGVGQMTPEFEEAVFALEKDGNYSAPFETSYGWHIVKRIKHEAIGSYQDMEQFIQNKVEKDSRSKLTEGALIQKIKKQYGFKEKRKNIKDFYTAIDSTYFAENWNKKSLEGMDQFLFKIGDKEITQADFSAYLNKTQRKRATYPIENLVNDRYERFKQNEIINYKNQKLDQEYPEFKALMEEYRNGILLFNITEDKIWARASKDTTGLKKFYEAHKEDYQWKPRLDAIYFSALNREVAEKVIDMLQDSVKYKKIVKEVNSPSQLNLKYEVGKYEKGDHPIVDQVEWKKGISKMIENNGRIDFVYVKEGLDAGYKTLKDAKGLITSDYQDYLEEKWIQELREKYEFKVDQSVLKKLKKELN